MLKKTVKTWWDRIWKEVDNFYEQCELDSKPDKWKDIPEEEFTCYECDQRDICQFVDDAYNTNGDCLAMK